MGADNGIAVRTVDLQRHYTMGESLIRAVDGVTLDVNQGEFVALLGSSGSGKSTLMNLIAGLDRPTGGAVFTNGRNIAEMDSEELARYRRHTIGMVFQSFNLIPTMTLLENVELPMRFAEIDKQERVARAQNALEHVRLATRMHHRPSELSGGEQQRGSLARAMVNQPTILVADEPTGNLDSKTGEEILSYIREFNQTMKMTVLMVTHERALAERHAHRIVTLADGRVLDDGRANGGAR